MGQASRKGSYEQRLVQAQARERLRLQAIEEKLALRIAQESEAWNTMVWWQIEMTEQRYARIMKRKLDSQLALATIFGIGGIYDGFRR